MLKAILGTLCLPLAALAGAATLTIPSADGPLTIDGGIPLAWDHAHLTAEGSAYAMERLAPMLGVKSK